MPIDSRSRPIGVTVLGLMAFAFSPVFIILLADFFWPHFRGKHRAFGHGGHRGVPLALLLADGSHNLFPAVSWVSYRAGLELYRLKRPGLLVAVLR
jgi:hypothetical protein